MTIFSVHHSTIYRYKNPIRPGVHQLMFRPRDSFDQRLLDCRLEIIPAPAEIRWIHDAFGNCITLVDFDAITTLLQFDTVIRLDHIPRMLLISGSRTTREHTHSATQMKSYRIWHATRPTTRALVQFAFPIRSLERYFRRRRQTWICGVWMTPEPQCIGADVGLPDIVAKELLTFGRAYLREILEPNPRYTGC